MTTRSAVCGALLSACIALLLVLPGSGAAAPAASAAGRDYRSAAASHHVPESLLLAIAYVDSHWRTPSGPSLDGGRGLTDLSQHDLRLAATLTGLPPARIAGDGAANLQGAAAVLAQLALSRRGPGLAGWYEAVSRFGGGRPFADEVYGRLAVGAAATVEGRRLRLAPQPGLVALARRDSLRAAAAGDYPRATWHPAARSNYTHAWRPLSSPITRIVIHVTESSWGSAVNWFQNPAAVASAHYIVRSSDGAIAQTVRENDIAYHAGNWKYNETSVGIEHEAFTSDCSWYTNAMYRSSARLAAYLVRRYGIPIDRRHIIGHSEVPDPNHPGQFGGSDHHTDPGPCWNWQKYISLVKADAAGLPSVTQPYRQVVTTRSPGAFSASANWHHVRARGGNDPYSYASPSTQGDPASFTLTIPSSGRYALFAQWPSFKNESRAAPVDVMTTLGLRVLHLNERRGSGTWAYLGTFQLAAGSAPDVLFPRTSGTRGRLVADAVEVVSH